MNRIIIPQTAPYIWVYRTNIASTQSAPITVIRGDEGIEFEPYRQFLKLFMTGSAILNAAHKEAEEKAPLLFPKK